MEWNYKKISELNVNDDLSAEIEFIKVKGIKLLNNKCQECPSGVANEDGSKCVMCKVNEYLSL